MKKLLSLTLLFISASALAQKDKTLSWDAPIVTSGTLHITVNSKKDGQYYGETFSIKPRTTKMLKLSLNVIFPVIVRMVSNDKFIINQKISKSALFIIPVTSLDTIKTTVIANVTAAAAQDITYEYYIADTAKVSVSGKPPKECFDQLLTMANTKFANLYNGNISGRIPDIEFANGLFASTRAVCENGYVQQYTGMALDEAAANKDVAAWNKMIKTWLKEYNITNIVKLNKNELIVKSNHLYDEATAYMKKNKKGDTLFVVSVFKKQASEGFYTGVVISAN